MAGGCLTQQSSGPTLFQFITPSFPLLHTREKPYSEIDVLLLKQLKLVLELQIGILSIVIHLFLYLLFHIGSDNSSDEVEININGFWSSDWCIYILILITRSCKEYLYIFLYTLQDLYQLQKTHMCIIIPALEIIFMVFSCFIRNSDINIYIYCIINQIWILTSYQIWILYPCTYVHSVFIIINNIMVFQKANPSRI
eukprot:91454_1